MPAAQLRKSTEINMQISQHFDVREFVPKHIWEKFGAASSWFVNPRIVHISEFYKSFWLTYYKKKLGSNKVKSVFIIVNDWHYGGSKQWRGLRTEQCNEGGKNSQHRYMNAFDCDIIIEMEDGSKIEADYNEVHRVIMENEREFMANGVTCVESPKFATTWLHTDCRWIVDQKHILVVNP